MLNDDEIEVFVEQDWEIHKRRIEEEQARWDIIHSFDGLTTEQATEQYFGGSESNITDSKRRTDASRRERADAARLSVLNRIPQPPAMKTEFELRFKGTFENLCRLADDLNSREQKTVYTICNDENGVGYIRFGKGEFQPSDAPRRGAYFGEIIARDNPSGGLILRVKIEDGEPNHALQWWQKLESAMARDGWLDAQPTANQAAGGHNLSPMQIADRSEKVEMVWTDHPQAIIDGLPNLPTPLDLPVPKNPFIAFEVSDWEVADDNLAQATLLFFNQLFEHSEWMWFRVVSPSEDTALVEIIGNRDGIDAHVRIKVRRSKLFIESDYRDWAVLSSAWEIFRQFLLEQAYIKPQKKRVFGFRIEYAVAVVVLGILIIIVSLVVSPEWARSNLTLVMLISLAFVAALTFIANFRKALE